MRRREFGMNVVLLRVGIDGGCGGIQGPLFADGSFEFMPIPDRLGVDSRSYGNTSGRKGEPLADYFPAGRRQRMAAQAMHVDPEFNTFTYGDPTRPKAGLRRLRRGDLLVFYAGLQGWDVSSPPGLYIVGYFEVAHVGMAGIFTPEELNRHFGQNFHVRHRAVFERDRASLVLVKGGPGSRLLDRAEPISVTGETGTGRPLKVLSPAMRPVFGDLGGRCSVQRSNPRWVDPAFGQGAASFVRSLL
jgi:hypothetical protein